MNKQSLVVEKFKNFPWLLIATATVTATLMWESIDHAEDRGFRMGVVATLKAQHVSGYFDGAHALSECLKNKDEVDNWECLVNAYPLEGVIKMNETGVKNASKELAK
ncbi:MAG: hypothetical protein JKY34_01270 [Kordiimonadaceae bacterium]|nr:hypothetical protein [Kordiimonadaceae bacterium]